MLDDCYWEDCTLIDLLEQAQNVDEVEEAYQALVRAIQKWHLTEEKPAASGHIQVPKIIFKNWVIENPSPLNFRLASYFIQMLFMVYKDLEGKRPTETLLLTYARMLNHDDQQLVLAVREYRNHLLDVDKLIRISHITLPDEWRIGEL
jgi:hypothetical protein